MSLKLSLVVSVLLVVVLFSGCTGPEIAKSEKSEVTVLPASCKQFDGPYTEPSDCNSRCIKENLVPGKHFEKDAYSLISKYVCVCCEGDTKNLCIWENANLLATSGNRINDQTGVDEYYKTLTQGDFNRWESITNTFETACMELCQKFGFKSNGVDVKGTGYNCKCFTCTDLPKPDFALCWTENFSVSNFSQCRYNNGTLWNLE